MEQYSLTVPYAQHAKLLLDNCILKPKTNILIKLIKI